MCAARHRPPAYAEHVSRRTLSWVLVGVQALLLLALVLLPRRSPSTASVVVGCALVAVAIALGWSAFRALGSDAPADPRCRYTALVVDQGRLRGATLTSASSTPFSPCPTQQFTLLGNS